MSLSSEYYDAETGLTPEPQDSPVEVPNFKLGPETPVNVELPAPAAVHGAPVAPLQRTSSLLSVTSSTSSSFSSEFAISLQRAEKEKKRMKKRRKKEKEEQRLRQLSVNGQNGQHSSSGPVSSTTVDTDEEIDRAADLPNTCDLTVVDTLLAESQNNSLDAPLTLPDPPTPFKDRVDSGAGSELHVQEIEETNKVYKIDVSESRDSSVSLEQGSEEQVAIAAAAVHTPAFPDKERASITSVSSVATAASVVTSSVPSTPPPLPKTPVPTEDFDQGAMFDELSRRAGELDDESDKASTSAESRVSSDEVVNYDSDPVRTDNSE